MGVELTIQNESKLIYPSREEKIKRKRELDESEFDKMINELVENGLHDKIDNYIQKGIWHPEYRGRIIIPIHYIIDREITDKIKYSIQGEMLYDYIKSYIMSLNGVSSVKIYNSDYNYYITCKHFDIKFHDYKEDKKKECCIIS